MHSKNMPIMKPIYTRPKTSCGHRLGRILSVMTIACLLTTPMSLAKPTETTPPDYYAGTFQGQLTFSDETPRYDQTISVTVSDDNSAQDEFTYKWYRDDTIIPDATAPTYSIAEADIGSILKVEVSAKDCVGTIIQATEEVQKAVYIGDVKEPELSRKTFSTISVAHQSGYEYSIDYGKTWTWNTFFSELEESTKYCIIQRVAATSTISPSAYSSSLRVETMSLPYRDPDFPDSPLFDYARNGMGVFTYEVQPAEDGTLMKKLPSSFASKKQFLAIQSEDFKISLDGRAFREDQLNIEVTVAPVTESMSYDGSLLYDMYVRVDGMVIPQASDMPLYIETDFQGSKKDHYKYVGVTLNEDGELELLGDSYYDGKKLSMLAYTISPFGAIYVDKTFQDASDHWGKEAIEALAARGIISGTSADTFSPDETITRAQFVTLVTRYFNLQSDATTSYEDVSEGLYYTRPVAAAKDLGLLPTSYKENFLPKQPITREEIMYILHQALLATDRENYYNVIEYDLDNYKDWKNTTLYARHSVKYFIAHDLIHGYSHHIMPQETSTRAEVAQLLYNLLVQYHKHI